MTNGSEGAEPYCDGAANLAHGAGDQHSLLVEAEVRSMDCSNLSMQSDGDEFRLGSRSVPTLINRT